jgi:hypothetical protein
MQRREDILQRLKSAAHASSSGGTAVKNKRLLTGAGITVVDGRKNDSRFPGETTAFSALSTLVAT